MAEYLTGANLQNYLDNPLFGQEAIVEGLIFKDTVNIIYSEPSAGKSVIAVNMLASMSGGSPVFGLFEMKRSVRCSYLQLEGSKEEQLGRLKEMISEIPVNYENICWHTSPIYVENPQSQQEMFEELFKYKPEVIFIDSFYCLTSHGLSSEKGFLPVRQLIKTIKDKTEATIIILHHSSKPQHDENGEQIEKEDPFLGSQYLKAFADLMIYCKRMSENKVLMRVTKASRNNEGIKQITLSFNKITWIVTALEEETCKSAIGQVCDFLNKEFKRGKRELFYEDIIKGTALTKRHIRRLKQDGHFNHLVEFKEIENHRIIWCPKNGKN